MPLVERDVVDGADLEAGDARLLRCRAPCGSVSRHGCRAEDATPLTTRHCRRVSQHRQQLVGDVGGGDAGDLGVVVGRRDLDDVGRDDVASAPARAGSPSSSREVRPPASGVPVPGRVRRVEHVDVDATRRPAGRRAARASARPRRRRRARRARRSARRRSRGRPTRAGRARTYSGPRMPTCRQWSRSSSPSSDGAAERRAVGVRLAEVGVPRVEVRVEVQHGDRPVQRRASRAAAAARSCGRRRGSAASCRRRRARAAPRSISPIASLDVERVDRDVAGVGDLLRVRTARRPAPGCTGAAAASSAGCARARTARPGR